MAIEVIDNQPIHLTPPGNNIDCKDCGGQTCMLIEHDDFLYLQLKMTSCGDDFICGQPNSDNLGAELVTDGGFASDLSNWNAQANWSWSAGTAVSDGNDGTLDQTIGITNGLFYLVSFVIVRNSGQLFADLGGTSISGSPYSVSGSYSAIVMAGASGKIEFDSDAFNGSVDNVSVKLVAPCWNTGGGLSITYTPDAVCINGSIDGTGTLFTDTLANGPGYYVVSFTISNYVSGTVQVQRDCTDTFLGGPFSLNGEKFAYGSFAAPGSLCFNFTAFTGCISDVHIHRLYIPQFIITSQTTGTQYFDINDSTFINLTEDRITLKFQPLEFLPYDCYKICVVDTCRIAGITNKVTNGTFDSDLSDWNPGSGWSWDGTNGGQALFERTAGTGSLSQVFSVSNINVCCQVTITDITTFLGSFLRLHLYDASSNSVTFLDITKPGTYSICGVGAEIALEPSNIANTIISLDNVGVFQITNCDDCSPFDYCSNCIKFAESLPCTLLVESYNDENGSWEFIWNNSAGSNIFKLQHRLDATLGIPKYPEDSVDYTFSTGETKDTFAQSEKFWMLHINQKDEIGHDCIRLQKRSDHLFITDENENRKEYWAERGDYNPKWVEPAGSNLAPAEFRVKLKNKTLYNNLCS